MQLIYIFLKYIPLPEILWCIRCNSGRSMYWLYVTFIWGIYTLWKWTEVSLL